MAKRCDICGVGPVFGSSISHAHNVTKRRWLPNLQSVRVKDATSGEVKRLKVCTKCIKANKVTKVIRGN